MTRTEQLAPISRQVLRKKRKHSDSYSEHFCGEPGVKVAETRRERSLGAHRSVSRVASALAWALLSLAASAQAEPSPAERETARSLMDEADALLRDGNVRAALERYQAADQLMHVPTTGLEVARTQAALHLLVEASATAIEVANSPPRENEPAIFAEARAAAQKLVDELRARIPSLSIRVEPLGVRYELSFDGVLVPDATHGLPFKLNPGTHKVMVQALGFETISAQVTLEEAQALEREFMLVAVTPVPPSLAVSPPPAASTQPVSERDDAAAAARTRGYVALVAGGVVLAAGVTTGILTVIKSNQIQQQCADMLCPRSVESDLNSANTLANVANVTLAIGLLATGYGLFELLNAGSDLQVSATGAGLRVKGAL
jgi:hypothetical protein